MSPSTQPENSSPELTIAFSAELSPAQINGTLKVLAEYYRACGGIGFEIEFEVEEAYLPELAHV
jgi:hypothetical protein